MLEYYKDKIHDELCGAKEYVKCALEYKSTHPNWAKMFLDMSTAEISHATNLYKIADEYYKSAITSYDEPPKYLKCCWEDIVDMYAEKSAKVKYMQEMYNK